MSLLVLLAQAAQAAPDVKIDWLHEVLGACAALGVIVALLQKIAHAFKLTRVERVLGSTLEAVHEVGHSETIDRVRENASALGLAQQLAHHEAKVLEEPTP